MFTMQQFSAAWNPVSPNIPVQFANALTQWHSACEGKTPTTFTTYQQFEKAREACVMIADQFAKMVAENKANPNAAAGITLIKNSTRERSAMREAIDNEYKQRIATVEGKLRHVEKLIGQTIGHLKDQYARMEQTAHNAEKAQKMMKGGASANPDIMKSLTQMAETAKTVEKGDKGVEKVMADLRGEPTVVSVRGRGPEGLCDDEGVGGDEKAKLSQFKENLKAFGMAEELARRTLAQATLTKQFVKACLTLAAEDKDAQQKTQAIVAKIGKKVDEAIERGSKLIMKNQTSFVDGFDAAKIDIAVGRKGLIDLDTILEDKLEMLPNRIKEIETLIAELAKMTPTSAKTLLDPIVAKREGFKKDVKEWMTRHEAARKKIPGLLKELKKREDTEKRKG